MFVDICCIYICIRTQYLTIEIKAEPSNLPNFWKIQSSQQQRDILDFEFVQNQVKYWLLFQWFRNWLSEESFQPIGSQFDDNSTAF